jgi:hypothetical protein
LPQLEGGRRNFATHLAASSGGLQTTLTDGGIWKGAAGRRLSEFVEELVGAKTGRADR